MTQAFRIQILTETLRQIALVPGPAKALTIFESVRTALGKREEECAVEIHTAFALFVRSGLVIIDDLPPRDEITIRADTTLTASGPLTRFIWEDPESNVLNLQSPKK